MKNTVKQSIYLILISVSHLANSQSQKPTKNDSLFLYHLTLTETYNTPSMWNESTMVTIKKHAEFLEELGEQGILSFAGRTLFTPGDPNLFGIAVINAKSLSDARQIMSSDPAVVAGIQQANIYPFSMGIKYLKNLDDN